MATSPGAPPEGWAVPAGRGASWWSEGWRLFAVAPVIWIVVMVLYLAIMFGLGLIPVIGQLASALFHPAFIAGLMIGCRAQDRGGELTIGHLFAGFGERLTPLFVLALLFAAGWFVVWIVAMALFVAVVGTSTLAALFSGDAMRAGVAMLSALSLGALVVLLVCALLVVPLLMAIWFAPALVVLRGDEPFTAMKRSFVACLRNVPPFLVYGLLGVLLALLATIPLGLGWVVLVPVSVASVYAGYKDIFGDSG